MKKLLLLIMLLLAVGLAACNPQVQESPTLTTAPTLKPTDSSAATQPASTPALIVPTQSLFGPDSGCTVIAREPTPGPLSESRYPPVTDADHVKGPEDARVTLIEYSDFQ